MTGRLPIPRLSALAPGWVRAIAGGLLWMVGLMLVLPDPKDAAWAQALLLLAPLVLLPMGMDLAAPETIQRWPGRLWHLAAALQFPSALLLAAAFFVPQGLLAAALAVPWLGTTAVIAMYGWLRLWDSGSRPLSEACIAAGLIYVVVGGAWAVCDRLGSRPLDFEAVIVFLTAIHFHYAGFTLPIATGLAMRQVPGACAQLAGFGVVLGVPLVAVGITATQLGSGTLPECLAAWLMAAGGTLTGWLHLRLALQAGRSRLVRSLWLLAAATLLGSMVLAALYGSRFYFSVAWLDIPWMRALHGTANALGFGLSGLLGWWLEKKKGDAIVRIPLTPRPPSIRAAQDGV